MRRSKLFLKTYKETPKDADSVNASYLTRGGFIKKHMAGAYSLLPLGFRVYKKIEKIVREEIDSIGGQEILMNVLQPKDIWEETGRWDKMDDIMYRVSDGDIGLGPTHEEEVVDIARGNIDSYRDLPRYLYQIQTKFRNEPRAKSGLLRGREFIMKDLYSFHETEDDFSKYYDRSKEAYFKIFSRCGLDAKLVEADGGVFSKYSHEFQVFSKAGEDDIFYCEKCDFAQNKEIAKVSAGDKCPKCDEEVKKETAIEVGNIFPLKTKFSKDMGLEYINKQGEAVHPIMGCYGIGLTRLLGTVVEVSHDESGIIWPESLAPYKVYLMSIGADDEAEKLYEGLISSGVEVLYDDRSDVSAGEKFADADLIGCPYRVLVTKKSLQAGGVELTERKSGETEIMSFEELQARFK